ncbi:MAG: polysaccharide pyruvyl transferase family protein [Thermoanaerobaculales bacterium]|nr:polysaccharide pyruvyl transferase family protein [Thermoanaerobaculales bacterium]
MSRILITNAYSARNRGDAAIILGMIESLRHQDAFPGAECLISSTDAVADRDAYPVPVVPSFHSIKNRFSSRPAANALVFLLVLLPASLAWAGARRFLKIELPIGGSFGELMEAYARADLVVAAGGGYLYTTSAIRGNLVLLINVYSFFFGVLLGKPVVLYAQSIGPFAGAVQWWFVRRIISRLSLVEVRELWSHALIEEWVAPAKLKVVADAAFLLDPTRPATVDLAAWGGGPTVGMTVRCWFRHPGKQAAYERTMAAFVDRMVEEYGAEVVFLPQVTYIDGRDDDREVARRVARGTAGDRVRVIEDELTAPEVKWLCGCMDYFVGTRMHSNIFALSSKVPSLAIAYQPKTEGIMRALGLADFVVPIEGLNLDELERIFAEMLRRAPEIRERLGAVLPILRADALEAGRLIAEVAAPAGGGSS